MKRREIKQIGRRGDREGYKGTNERKEGRIEKRKEEENKESRKRETK